jgi:methionyl-tRNA formyltransferase
MGTPEFAVPALTRLVKNFQVVAVVTQPDRPSGRGRKVVASPVKMVAEANNLTVLQPPTLKKAEVVAQLQALQPDLIVVAAFGQILRTNVLTLPPFGCINVHASLLPRWRGAAPIAAAIRAGDAEAGVTIMRMDEGLDTGPMLSRRAIPIAPNHTGETLTAELADLGADLLLETLPDWLAGRLIPQPQDDSLATLAPRLKKEAGEIDWSQSAVAIERLVRAFDPWPGTFTNWQRQPLKIIAVTIGAASDQSVNLSPGEVFSYGKAVAVATGDGAILLQQLQPAGKRSMAAMDFVRGVSDFVGTRLGVA